MLRSTLALGCLLASAAAYSAPRAASLCVAENGGHGEQPPPIGGLVAVDTATAAKRTVAKGLQDPVWVTSDADSTFAYVGLFHAGQIVRVDLANGTTTVVATGLSCPEGVALSGGALFTVENPVGDECRGHDLKPAAQLTRIDLASGAQTKVAGLLSPHGLATAGGDAFVCEWGAHQLTRVDLRTGTKARVAPLASPSGCAVGGAYAYAVEQGDTDGSLVGISLSSGDKTTLVSALAEPMGVAVDVKGGFAYVGERGKDRVWRVAVGGGKPEVFAAELNSPIGLTMC